MNHHGGVDPFESPLLDHPDLAPAALLGGGPQDPDPTTELFGNHRGPQSRSCARRCNDVVTAGVAYAR